MNIFKFFLNRYYRNKEMVSYWKTKDSVEAKFTKAKDGSYIMPMEGEKYPFPGYPRGHLLFGSLSPLKHQIKNKIFNDIWAQLEAQKPTEEIMAHLRLVTLPDIFALGQKSRYDMLPPEKMVPAVRELWRAMTAIEDGSHNVRALKEILCFILQEDDAYRFRVQWIMKFFNPNSLWRRITKRSALQDLDFALTMLEHAEVIGDMKERIRLLRRVLLFVLKDKGFRYRFERLVKEVDWTKLRLSNADKYFFRGKYFKVDFPEYSY